MRPPPQGFGHALPLPRPPWTGGLEELCTMQLQLLLVHARQPRVQLETYLMLHTACLCLGSILSNKRRL